MKKVRVRGWPPLRAKPHHLCRPQACACKIIQTNTVSHDTHCNTRRCCKHGWPVTLAWLPRSLAKSTANVIAVVGKYLSFSIAASVFSRSPSPPPKVAAAATARVVVNMCRPTSLQRAHQQGDGGRGGRGSFGRCSQQGGSKQ